MSRNEKFWVDQMTPPPPGNDKGWGTTKGGVGLWDTGDYTYRVALWAQCLDRYLPANSMK